MIRIFTKRGLLLSSADYRMASQLELIAEHATWRCAVAWLAQGPSMVWTSQQSTSDHHRLLGGFPSHSTAAIELLRGLFDGDDTVHAFETPVVLDRWFQYVSMLFNAFQCCKARWGLLPTVMACYGHLPVITGYKWDYTVYKRGYKYL